MFDLADTSKRVRAAIGAHCVLLEEQTQEERSGWVFFYQSSAYIEAGEPSHMLAGNAPLVVFQDSGEIRATGTGREVEHYLAPLREEWTQRHG